MPYMSLCVVMVDPGNLRDQIFPRTGFAPSAPRAAGGVRAEPAELWRTTISQPPVVCVSLTMPELDSRTCPQFASPSPPVPERKCLPPSGCSTKTRWCRCPTCAWAAGTNAHWQRVWFACNRYSCLLCPV